MTVAVTPFQMKSLLCTFVVVVLLQVCKGDEIHLEYYAQVSLSCDAEKYNITNAQDIVKRYWLLPNGDLIKVQTKTEHLNFDSNFTLTVEKIDDPDFGYYYCLMVRSDNTIGKIRHGLNVDGADFSGLLEKYRKNAIIGGIAAGTLFVIVSGFCLVWQLRYQRRDQRNKAVDELDNAINVFDLKEYDNVGFEEAKTDRQSATNGKASPEIDDRM